MNEWMNENKWTTERKRGNDCEQTQPLVRSCLKAVKKTWLCPRKRQEVVNLMTLMNDGDDI